MSIVRALAAAAFAAAALAATTLLAAPPAAADRLIETTADPSTVSMPYPGHSTDFTLTIDNVADADVDLGLTAAAYGAAAYAAADTLRVTLTDADGGTVLDATLGTLRTEAVHLGLLAEGDAVSLSGSAYLPRSVGNELQGVGGEVTFTVAATTAAGATDGGVTSSDTKDHGWLPGTGAPAVWPWVLLGLAAVAAGWRLLRAARRRHKETEKTS